MRLYLVHHGEAVGPEVDVRRPLSEAGMVAVDAIAAQAAALGVRPAVIWHSGKLRAKQTAEIFWKVCNPLASLNATRDLQPDDPVSAMRDRLRFETRDVLIAGHFPHLPRLLALLTGEGSETIASFPVHGVIALVTDDDGHTWREVWRLESGKLER